MRPEMARGRRVAWVAMKICAISHVRNECDIVEAFVRHTLAFVDRLYIVDNASSDTTPEILARLAAEDLPLTVGWDADVSFYQSAKTTAQLRAVMADSAWDFVLPLDGDEFIKAADRAALEHGLGDPAAGYARFFGVQHYAPLARDKRAQPDVPRRITHRLEPEPPMPPGAGKVAVPGALARFQAISIGDGNHGIDVAGIPMPASLVPGVRLAHFPIRSIDQYLSRTVVAHLAWSSRADFNRDVVSHIQDAFRRLKNGQALSMDDLLEAARVYARHGDGPLRLIRDPLVAAYDRLRYPDLIRIDVLSRILTAAEGLAERVRAVAR